MFRYLSLNQDLIKLNQLKKMCTSVTILLVSIELECWGSHDVPYDNLN